MKRIFSALFLSAAAWATANGSYAQDFPTKPVVIVVPAAAGGPTDTLTRVLAASMGGVLKQQVLIDNSGGTGVAARAAQVRNRQVDTDHPQDRGLRGLSPV